jgi:hypothetical protein
MVNKITTDLKEAIKWLIASPYKNRIKFNDNIEYYLLNGDFTNLRADYKDINVKCVVLHNGFTYLASLDEYELITIED